MSTIAQLAASLVEHWNDAEKLFEIGDELENRSRFDIARKALMRTIELEPQNIPDAYLSLAWTYFRDVGNYAEIAEKTLVDGIETTDSDYLKTAYIAFCEDDALAQDAITQAHYSSELRVQFTLASSLLWRGNRQDALEVFRSSFKETDENDTSNYLNVYCQGMNWLYAQKQDVDPETEILPVLDRLKSAHPKRYNPRALRIQYYQVQKNWEKVRDEAKQTLAVLPDEETTMVALGIAYEKLDDDERASSWYQRAIGAKPSYARARILLGKLYEKHNAAELADETFREIPTAFPEYRMGRIQLALFLYRTERTEEALTLFKNAYPSLRPHQKGWIQNDPEGKIILEQADLA